MLLPRALRAAHRRLTQAWPVRPVHSVLHGPIASISFDDFPRDAWTVGAGLLEQRGARGTYFVSAAFAPRPPAGARASGRIPGLRHYEPADLIEARTRGHEIGCHSFDHRRLPTLDDAEIQRSCRANAAFVEGLIGEPMTSFAYPQGAVDIRTKRLCGRHFQVCRGAWPGLNHGRIDLALLASIALDERFDRLNHRDLQGLLARAHALGAWLIFHGHDVSPDPSPWGCTPRALAQLLAMLEDSGIAIITLRDAAKKVLASSDVAHMVATIDNSPIQ